MASKRTMRFFDLDVQRLYWLTDSVTLLNPGNSIAVSISDTNLAHRKLLNSEIIKFNGIEKPISPAITKYNGHHHATEQTAYRRQNAQIQQWQTRRTTQPEKNQNLFFQGPWPSQQHPGAVKSIALAVWSFHSESKELQLSVRNQNVLELTSNVKKAGFPKSYESGTT